MFALQLWIKFESQAFNGNGSDGSQLVRYGIVSPSFRFMCVCVVFVVSDFTYDIIRKHTNHFPLVVECLVFLFSFLFILFVPSIYPIYHLLMLYLATYGYHILWFYRCGRRYTLKWNERFIVQLLLCVKRKKKCFFHSFFFLIFFHSMNTFDCQLHTTLGAFNLFSVILLFFDDEMCASLRSFSSSMRWRTNNFLNVKNYNKQKKERKNLNNNLKFVNAFKMIYPHLKECQCICCMDLSIQYRFHLIWFIIYVKLQQFSITKVTNWYSISKSLFNDFHFVFSFFFFWK